jgi:hypothetical protein
MSETPTFNPDNQENTAEQYDLSFEKDTSKENIVYYIFKHVIVMLDTTGKNQSTYPEISFGTYDKDPNQSHFDQPYEKRPEVDMKYIVECIKVVAQDSDAHELWFYPYGDDSLENPDRRSQVRARLFSRYVDLVPTEDNFGYVIKI